MVLLADVGGISGVRSTLSSVKVPPDVINSIVAILETSPDELAPNQLRPVKDAWFGSAGSAQYLGTHTTKAHLALQNTLIEAVSGIAATMQAMQDFDKEISAKDADSEAAALALLHRTELAVDQMDGDRRTPPAQGPADTTGRDD
ncbi:hypothetical protein [Nocardioides sp. Soil805]|uniref:hypothetical protein n=1 Tax=Nocardioides sp. Soil805 TaxID=1736416 RepID=UPI0007029E85|nr:hypothetical protein [Nocardioides sp. Soil805]KRF35276.1 hypothetical protein ASG94_14330 [Nocardioides sp. Soil805]